jgi:hypothetical protein
MEICACPPEPQLEHEWVAGLLRVIDLRSGPRLYEPQQANEQQL